METKQWNQSITSRSLRVLAAVKFWWVCVCVWLKGVAYQGNVHGRGNTSIEIPFIYLF